MLWTAKRLTLYGILAASSFVTWTCLQLDIVRNGFGQAIQRNGVQNYDSQLPLTHSVIRSVSTTNGSYIAVDFAGKPTMNPNIIPHPVLDDVWILVAQLKQDTQHYVELVCNAHFVGDILRCTNTPSELPIMPTFGDKCTGELAYFELNQGPHDARVFHGPRAPYTIYGSNSKHTCFGQWICDFRDLVEWGDVVDSDSDPFTSATELQRPPPWNPIEKNWFLFWDIEGQMYAHYDLIPRVFAKVDPSGAVGSNLALIAESDDARCMMKYMPEIGPELESIHQATNSLSITMCSRHDISCTPDISNTYVFTIVQHKKYFNFHAVYEPYVLVFEQTPPFKIRAISKKPLWIYGRRIPSNSASANKALDHSAQKGPELEVDGDEMIYVTSISWKNRGQRYHGHLDDVLFLAFGIEDKATATIDVTAEDLLRDLVFC